MSNSNPLPKEIALSKADGWNPLPGSTLLVIARFFRRANP